MPSAERWLLRDVRIGRARLDCRIRDGRVVQLGKGLAPSEGEFPLDGRGGALIPGLIDHHIHLRAAAAARHSLDLRGGGLDCVPRDSGTGWLRVIGAGVELTRADLDVAWPDRPVRVQHRSGALWTVNSM